MSRLLFIISFLLGTSYFPGSNGDKWELKKYEEGIAVYTRMAENSNYKELRSVVRIKTSLSSIMAVLQDWDSYPQWSYRCGKSATLKTISETELIHYQTVMAPWPADDRDFVVNIKITQDPVTKVVVQKATNVPTFIPEFPDHVRIKEFKATWTLTPTFDGYVNLEYQLLVNPGGNVPAWMVNMAVVEGPFQSTKNLKDRVFLEKYQKTQFPYLKELK